MDDLLIDQDFLDEASEALEIKYPAIIEKDFYVTQLLKVISFIKNDSYDLVFCGGTCLSKTHHDIQRMSEDIDIKMVAKQETLSKGHDARRARKKEVFSQITTAIQSHKHFNLEESHKKNENGYQHYSISYTSKCQKTTFLRPSIKLELVESPLHQSFVENSVSSLINHLRNKSPEIAKIKCVQVESTIAEKMIAMLCRVVDDLPGRPKQDPALVRHMYDLFILTHESKLNEEAVKIFKTAAENNIKRFRSQHRAFTYDLKGEFERALNLINNNPDFEKNYQQFLGPLVYKKSPPEWEEVKQHFNDLINDVCNRSLLQSLFKNQTQQIKQQHDQKFEEIKLQKHQQAKRLKEKIQERIKSAECEKDELLMNKPSLLASKDKKLAWEQKCQYLQHNISYQKKYLSKFDERFDGTKLKFLAHQKLKKQQPELCEAYQKVQTKKSERLIQYYREKTSQAKKDKSLDQGR